MYNQPPLGITPPIPNNGTVTHAAPPFEMSQFEVLPGSTPIDGATPPIAGQPVAAGASAFEVPPAPAPAPVPGQGEDAVVMGKIKSATEAMLADTAKTNNIPYEPDANPDGSLNTEAAARNMGVAQQAMGKTLERPTAAIEPYLPEEDRKGILDTIKKKLEAATDTPQFNWSEMEEDEKSSLLIRLGLNMMSVGGQPGAAQQGLLGVLGAAGQATLDDWDKKAETERRSKESAAVEEVKSERKRDEELRSENKDIRNINRGQKVQMAAERRKVLDTIETSDRKHFLDMEKAATKHGYNISLEGIKHVQGLSRQAHANSLGMERDAAKSGTASGKRFDKETLAQWNLVSIENPEWVESDIAKEVSRRHDVRYGSGGKSSEQKAITTVNRAVVKEGNAKIKAMKENYGREWKNFMSGAGDEEKRQAIYDQQRKAYVDNGGYPENYTFAHQAETADTQSLADMVREGDSLSPEKQEMLRNRLKGLPAAQQAELKALLQQATR